MTSLIELQAFFMDAARARLVNNRPTANLSDQPNDLAPIIPTFFWGDIACCLIHLFVGSTTREIFGKIFCITLHSPITFG